MSPRERAGDSDGCHCRAASAHRHDVQTEPVDFGEHVEARLDASERHHASDAFVSKGTSVDRTSDAERDWLRSHSPDIHHDVSKPRAQLSPSRTPCPECRARNDRRTFCAAAVVGDSTASRINTPIACRPLGGAGGRASHLARAPAQRMEDLAGIGDLLEPWKPAPLEQSSLIRIARCGNLSRGRILPKIMEPPTLLHQVRVSSRDSIGAGQFFCF